MGSRATALPPDERRATIVEAALPLLLLHGEKVTTRQIADAAGIAEGTIFRVFADKDALITQAIDVALDPGPLEEAIGAIDPSQPTEAALAAVVGVLQQRVIDVFRLASSVGASFQQHARGPMPDSPALIALLERHREVLRVSPEAAARYLRAVTLALTHPMLVDEPASHDDVVRLFLHGVTAGSPSC